MIFDFLDDIKEDFIGAVFEAGADALREIGKGAKVGFDVLGLALKFISNKMGVSVQELAERIADLLDDDNDDEYTKKNIEKLIKG